ncbi:predicted protein [Candidatus Vecturithrix granuli]|uniref:Uncharacterized protein n=1 Tax=Vecturithrix granuli TaxID=1499967 RepID=A0A0S6W5I3_VECG1|nr:predicted protein [Candidatus Vecturithrix granuli]
MKDYILDFFTYCGCTLHQNGQVLQVELTPELTRHFEKPTLRLVFRPEDAGNDTDLATYNSYITSRIYDIVKHFGQRVAVVLPTKPLDFPTSQTSLSDHAKTDLIPYHCSILRRRSREVKKIETYLTFRVAYYSNEKTEELVTVGIDAGSKIHTYLVFPYSAEILRATESHRFPYSHKQMHTLYNMSLEYVKRLAHQKIGEYQKQLSEQYHQDVLRLEGYYHQMIEEIPDIASNREEQVQHLQHEYRNKVAEELHQCQVHAVIEPVSVCAVTIPFRRERYTLTPEKVSFHSGNLSIDVLQNLFSGNLLFPCCAICGQEMHTVGICDDKFHVVCQDCLKTCSRCGKHVCQECGTERCADCGEWVCRECSVRCHLCGKRFCSEHTFGCLECRQHFCRHCGAFCEECGQFVGKIHLIDCDLSHKTVCFHCLVTCSCCDRHVSQSQAHTCAFCGQQMCTECTFRCDVCGELICVHHIRECELSGKMVCPRHLGVCEQCSRQVSTPLLSKCDVCGKKICSQCALQCHGCNVFFCEDHSEELLTCPACGQTYCHLCYTGQDVCSSCQKKKAALISSEFSL